MNQAPASSLAQGPLESAGDRGSVVDKDLPMDEPEDLRPKR